MKKGIVLFLIFVGVPAHAQASKDYRLKLALELHTLGEKLQKIQDQEGLEKAHDAFDTLIAQNSVVFQTQIKEHLSALSEEKAVLILEKFKTNQTLSEESALILSDHSLTAKQKLEHLQIETFLAGYHKDIKTLQASAGQVGYQKVFQDLANTIQDRGYFDTQYGKAGFIAVSSSMFFVVVYFLAIIPPPLSYAMAVVPAGLFIWMMWDSATSPEEKASDFLLPPDDFNADPYKLIPRF
ncbi:MAG: hypothetical protein HYY62_08295 [Deltaproteobacteria bacterium]|nr:hypothetical protein [Deltaproteobacteria bacterium]